MVSGFGEKVRFRLALQGGAGSGKTRGIAGKGTALLRHRSGEMDKERDWHFLTCQPLFSCISRVTSFDLPNTLWGGDKRSLILG